MPVTLPASPAIADRSAVAAYYSEHGFYHARGLIAPSRLAELERDFDRIVTQLEASGANINARWKQDTTTALDGGGGVVIHTHQVQKYSAAWGRFLYDEGMLDVAECLLGPDILLHHSKLFLKPAGRGAAFPPHQDHSYFPTIGHAMLATVVYLTPADDENGCLRVWPGTHLLGPLPASAGGDQSFATRFPIEDSLALVADPGDMVFFSYLTVHGSRPNRSPRPRKSVLLQLYSGQDQTIGKVHADSALVLRGWNHHMDRERANAG